MKCTRLNQNLSVKIKQVCVYIFLLLHKFADCTLCVFITCTEQNLKKDELQVCFVYLTSVSDTSPHDVCHFINNKARPNPWPFLMMIKIVDISSYDKIRSGIPAKQGAYAPSNFGSNPGRPTFVEQCKVIHVGSFPNDEVHLFRH